MVFVCLYGERLARIGKVKLCGGGATGLEEDKDDEEVGDGDGDGDGDDGDEEDEDYN